MEGEGLQPNTLPRPVVKQTTLAPPADLPRRGHRIEARRIHEHEPFLRDRLGIFHDVDQVRAAGLGHRAERLLDDCRQPARLVAGRRVGVDLLAVLVGVLLPPAHQLDELLADLAADRAAREQVLGAIGFGRLRQDHRAAVPHHEIAGDAKRRVGRDAGIAVRAAALQGDVELARRNRLRDAPHSLRPAPRGRSRCPASTVLRVPPMRLDVHVADPVGQALLPQQAADLVHLAAEPDHDDMREIRMPRVAGERAAQEVQRFARRHAAAGLVRERDYAVHVRVVRQRVVPGERVALEHVRDQARHVGAAIHRGQDADVVARRDAPVRAADALERGGRLDHSRSACASSP